MKGATMRGILLSLMAILLVSGMMGVAYAKSDSPNNQNHFSHHKIDLKLKDQDEPWADGVSATWAATNMAPGDEFAFDESFVGLRSDRSRRVAITCDYNPWADLYPDEMAEQMVITKCVYKNKVWQIDCLTGELRIRLGRRNTLVTLYTNRHWQVPDFDEDGRITFYDLKQSPLTNLPSPRKGKGARFEMSVRFHQDAGNEFQGDTFNLTMIYSLEPR